MNPLYAFLLVSTALLAACVQRLPDAVPTAVEQNVREQQTLAQKSIHVVSRPATGERAQREIGETIIDELLEESIDAIVLTAPVVFPHLNPPQRFPAGMKFLHISDTPTTRIYCKAHCLEQKNGIVSAAGEPSIVIAPSMFSIESVVTAVRQDTLQKKLVYTGRSGKTIFLSYREFVNDMARPAFTQDLTFDISNDRIVGFRGARIEVMTATNTTINYRVLNGFQGIGGVTQPEKRQAGKVAQDGKTIREVRSVNEGKSVVCKRVDGRVETLGEAECAIVGIAL